MTYSYQKSFFDKLNINLATVRAGNVIGGGDDSKFRIFPDIVNAILKRKPLMLRNPKAIRPWQHVLDPLCGYLNLAEKLSKKTLIKNRFIGAWNFGPVRESNKSVLNLVKEVNKHLKLNFILKKKNRFKESNFLALDIKKSKKYLNWKPKISFQESVNLTLDWYLAKNKKKITLDQIKKYFNI